MPDLILTRIFDEEALSVKILRKANNSPWSLLLIACAIMALPAILLAWSAAQGKLGVNPLDVVTRVPGYWSLFLLLAALLIAPLRFACVEIARATQRAYGKRQSDWNFLIRLRRPIGLASYFYALFHVTVYAALSIDFNWADFQEELLTKPFIAFGVITFVMLTPLAITSTNGWMKRLKRNWKHLHNSIYLAALFAVSHFYLLSKPGVTTYRIFALVLAALFIFRAVKQWQKSFQPQDAIDGTVPERPPRPNSMLK